MAYCATDVLATHRVYARAFEVYEEMFPSAVTFAGLMEMSVPYLPMEADAWDEYIDSAQGQFQPGPQCV